MWPYTRPRPVVPPMAFPPSVVREIAPPTPLGRFARALLYGLALTVALLAGYALGLSID